MIDVKKILGLDVGDRRIGIALSFEGVIFPRETIIRKNEKETVDFLKRYCDEEGIQMIVLGLPLGENEEETGQSKKIRAFAEKLEKNLNVPIAFQEESYSTQEAVLKMGKYTKEKRDMLSAVVILERYLAEN